MGLPVISHPTFSLVLPSTGQTVTFRPFLVKEEKILLVAQASEDRADIVRAIKQVISNCLIEPKIDVNDFTTFDLEYFFIKLRAKSVQNIITLSYKDNEDNNVYEVEVDLDQVDVIKPEGVESNIEITSTSGITLKYPTMRLMDDVEHIDSAVDFNFAVMLACIELYYVGDNVYKIKDYSKAEAAEFLESLDVATYQKIQKFVEAMPRLEHTVSYTNTNGREVKITLKTLTDFFTLG